MMDVHDDGGSWRSVKSGVFSFLNHTLFTSEMMVERRPSTISADDGKIHEGNGGLLVWHSSL